MSIKSLRVKLIDTRVSSRSPFKIKKSIYGVVIKVKAGAHKVTFTNSSSSWELKN